MENHPPYLIDSVDNALSLLIELRQARAMTVSSAAEMLGVARSSAHRLLRTLLWRGFVVQDAAHRYLPGPMLLSLADADSLDVVRALARAPMMSLCDALGETVNLGVLRGATMRFVESLEGSQPLRVGARIGVSLPAARTSGGKVLLAELTRVEVDALHPDIVVGSGAYDRLHRQLSLTRRRGYGSNVEETEPGVVALAVPLRGPDATALAALIVSVPTVRYRGQADAERLLPPLRAAAEHVRGELAQRVRRM